MILLDGNFRLVRKKSSGFSAFQPKSSKYFLDQTEVDNFVENSVPAGGAANRIWVGTINWDDVSHCLTLSSAASCSVCAMKERSVNSVKNSSYFHELSELIRCTNYSKTVYSL